MDSKLCAAVRSRLAWSMEGAYEHRLATSTVSAEGAGSPELSRKACMPTTLEIVVAGKKSGMQSWKYRISLNNIHACFVRHGAVFSIHMRSWSKTAPLGSFTSDEDQHPLTNISSFAYCGGKNTSLGRQLPRAVLTFLIAKTMPWQPVPLGCILAIVQCHNRIAGEECTKISAIFDLAETQAHNLLMLHVLPHSTTNDSCFLKDGQQVVRSSPQSSSLDKSPIRVAGDHMKFRLTQQRFTDHTIDFMTVQQLIPLCHRLA
ncbi:hypothetical protein T01_14247 [Trichinella spiralis]|uniref:Uncharacterized protein n=1 Tax=Trichinella spiralis TaxID=6334 RepID=A0A0V1BJ32_TRISP|nr:hypothetical protein T01_14247 [Trichinella spiralis]